MLLGKAFFVVIKLISSMVSRNEAAFFLAVVLFALAVSLIAYFLNAVNPYNLAARLFALNGFIALSIASILTAFLKEVTLFSRNPSLTITTLPPGLCDNVTPDYTGSAAESRSLSTKYQFAHLFLFSGSTGVNIYIALAAVLSWKISTYRVFFMR